VLTIRAVRCTNLEQSKIRRVIFETMSKWDGWKEVPQEISQVKQIASRAGRYGMRVEGGVVATLEPSDLPLLKAAMDAKPEPLRYARIGFISSTLIDIFGALPCGSTAMTVRDALLFCSVLPPSMAVMCPNTKEVEAMRYIDSFSQDLTFNDPRASARRNKGRGYSPSRGWTLRVLRRCTAC